MSAWFDRKIMALAALAGACFWFMDSVLDFYFKPESSSFLTTLMLDAPSHEFYIRPLVVSFFFASAAVISFLHNRTREKAESFMRLFENMQDAIFIFSADPAGKLPIIDANNRACSLFGYERRELLELSLSDLAPGDEPSRFTENMCLPQGGLVRCETGMVNRQGGRFFAEVFTARSTLGKRPVYFCVVKDITARKKIENDLVKSEQQLQVLASELLNAQENERRRISVGLHDELGQALMHLKFRLGSLIRKGAPSAAKDWMSTLSYMDEIIEYVRKLSRDLSPTVLDELGLTSALHYLIEEFGQHYDIRCESVRIDDIDGLFSERAQVGIFRIFQETLTNVARHSRARSVSVAVLRQEGFISFAVEDDGEGFDVNDALSVSGGVRRGIGIASMQERLRMVGGRLEILSRKGAGTRVNFTVPLEMRDEHSVAI